MADDLVINRAEMHALLYGDNGPVMWELVNLGKRVERGAKRRSKGRIAKGVQARAPKVDAQGPHIDIETAAEDERGAPIGLFTEVGTQPHVIESHGDYPLRSQDGRVFGRKVNHPGTEAQPHLRPALYEDIS